PFVLHAAIFARDGQQTVRLSLRDVVRWIEDREALPDDLLRLVPLQAFAAGIPRQHDTLRVQREDGVIGNAIDEQPVQALVDLSRSVGGCSRERRGSRARAAAFYRFGVRPRVLDHKNLRHRDFYAAVSARLTWKLA